MIIPCVGGALERDALATQFVHSMDRVTSLRVIAPEKRAKMSRLLPGGGVPYQMTTSAAWRRCSGTAYTTTVPHPHSTQS